MTPTMEKAARAVWDRREARNPIRFTRMSWEDGTPLAKVLLVDDLRTALLAIREPDDAFFDSNPSEGCGCPCCHNMPPLEFTRYIDAIIGEATA